MTMKCAYRVGSCPVECGRPGPVFGPAVPYFLALGGGSHCSAAAAAAVAVCTS